LHRSSKRAALIDEVDPSAAKFYYPFYKKRQNEADSDIQTAIWPREQITILVSRLPECGLTAAFTGILDVLLGASTLSYQQG